MEGFAPTKQFLPVVLSVRLLDKDILLKNVTVSRTDSLNDVKGNIQRRLAENGNPLDDWGKNAIFILRAYVKISFFSSFFSSFSLCPLSPFSSPFPFPFPFPLPFPFPFPFPFSLPFLSARMQK